MQKLIETRCLSKRYPGIVALDRVDFDLEPGEVHVLFGENGAGKSTLISLLAGANTPSDGEILLNGKQVAFENVGQAQSHGIYTVVQEFSLVPSLTVAENIFLGWEIRKGPFLNRRAMRERSRQMLSELGFEIDPTEIVAHLSRAQQQMVEITKAFHGDLKVLILDEPTASLTDKEVDHLFDFVRGLKNRGVGIVYISHRIHEFNRIAERVTVLRDGAKIATVAMSDTDDDKLIEMMTGRSFEQIYPTIKSDTRDVLLTVEALKSYGVKTASFEVRAGEVLGVAGLVGSGKSRLFRTIMGLAPKSSGRVKLRGRDITQATTRDIIKSGMYYLSSDRKSEGLDLAASSRDNLSVNIIADAKNQHGKFWINWHNVSAKVDGISDHVELRPTYRSKPVSQLSGGNQQKVLFGKCFGQNADVIIFDEPTVGVDMGTRAALYLQIKDLAEAGKAVVVISSDLPEVINISHRLLVLANGHISAELSNSDMTEERVLKYFFDENGVKQ